MIPSVVNYRPHLRQPRKSRPSSASLPLFSSTSSASFSFISHLPYLLPSSVSCNSFVCHSYANSASRTVLRDENCRGVYQQFPNRNVPALAGWNIPALGTNAPAPVGLEFSRSCPKGKSFSCNTHASPHKCCKQKTYAVVKPFGCNTYRKHGGSDCLVCQQEFVAVGSLRRSFQDHSLPEEC